MDTFSNWIQLFAAFVSTVLLPLILIRSQKRKSEAEADKSVAENITGYAAEWKDLYEEKAEHCGHLEKRIDLLHEENNGLRTRIKELTEANTQLKLQNASLEFRKCNKRGCADRIPPSDF